MIAYIKKILVVIALIVLGLFIVRHIFGSQRADEMWHEYPSAIGDDNFYKYGEFVINPDTIFSSLDTGDTNVFMPYFGTPETPDQQPVNSIYWHESDYLKVANGLNRHIWGQSLDNWKLSEVLLPTECNKYSQGFANGYFTFFQTLWSNGSIFYIVRSMNISQQFNTLSWGGDTTYAHPIFGWKGYDLSKMKITAEDALNIAEQQGGEKFRLTYSNQCGIFVSLGDSGWRIIYSRPSYSFIIDIDPYTGAFKVVNPKP